MEIVIYKLKSLQTDGLISLVVSVDVKHHVYFLKDCLKGLVFLKVILSPVALCRSRLVKQGVGRCQKLHLESGKWYLYENSHLLCRSRLVKQGVGRCQILYFESGKRCLYKNSLLLCRARLVRKGVRYCT